MNINEDYNIRINRVFKYIDEHLREDLSLSVLAKIALFSPFHFHRIFKFITTETVNEYVSRKRIEKAALDLLHKEHTISELAHQYGFSESSSFSRSFKKHFGESPMAFKKSNPNRHSKIRQLESKIGQDYPDHEKYICIMNELKNWIDMNAKIEIKEFPKMHLASITCQGPQNLAATFQKLIKWATPNALMHAQTKMFTVYFDSFKVTEAHKVRMSAGLLLEKQMELDEGIELLQLEAGKHIVGYFEIKVEEFEKSWTGLFLWMNEQGYKKADQPPFEMYYNNFNEHPEKICFVDFCIPIE